VNLPPDTLAQCTVNQLMARERPQALERTPYQQRGEMRVVVRPHVYLRVRNCLADEVRDLSWIHMRRYFKSIGRCAVGAFRLA